MCKEQNTTQVGCPGEDRLEAEGTQGVRSMEFDEERKVDATAATLLEQVVEEENFLQACLRVTGNKGAPGIDGMTVEALLAYLERHKDRLIGSILNGSYRPKPVRRVEIPKPDGWVRLLGVPTVVDRVVQQAVAQVLTPIYEPIFSDHSYGFRPNRSCHDAIREAKGYFDEGYKFEVDIDLDK